jgi:hypothetical protein
MIVQRITVHIKPGKINEAVELAKQARRRWSIPGRLYSSIYGTFNTVVLDFEAENQAELDKYWEETFADEEWGAFLAKWDALHVAGDTNELWNLVDF